MSTQTCPLFGTETSEAEESRHVGFVLNTQFPAQCNGTAKAWNFCYYGRGTPNATLETDFLSYRPFGSGPEPAYHLVSSTRVVRAATDTGFHCESSSLSESEFFEVQVGDVIGACLRTDEGYHPIGVLSAFKSGFELQRRSRNRETCLPSDVAVEEYSTLDSQNYKRTSLHLSIVIGKFCVFVVH